MCNLTYLMWLFYQGLDDLQKSFWAFPILRGTLNNSAKTEERIFIWGDERTFIWGFLLEDQQNKNNSTF